MTKLTDERSRALARIPYLRRLAEAERDALAVACTIKRCTRGSELFAEGEPPAGVFLILEGRIKLVRASVDGREQVLHEEGPGTTLAEVPVFDGAGYVGTAIAVEDSTLLFVPRAPLLDALQRNPASWQEVMRVLASRVRRFAALVEDLSTRGVAQRLAGYLLRESERAADARIRLPPTREQLAAHLGTVREQASRALSQLKRSGMIDLAGRDVRLKDPRRLRALAGSRSGRPA